MGTLKTQILEYLIRTGGKEDDDRLAELFGVRRQATNQACRQLEADGCVTRLVGPAGKIVNRAAPGQPRTHGLEMPQGSSKVNRPARRVPLLMEDDVKRAVQQYLEGEGFHVSVAWGRERGIDIEATKAGERIIVEAPRSVRVARFAPEGA